MTTQSSLSSVLVPELADKMDNLLNSESLKVGSLEKGNVVTIITRNSKYEFIIFNPNESLACMFSTNPRYIRPTICRIQGTTAGGSMILSRTIVLNGFLEVYTYEYGRINLSQTTKFTLDTQNNTSSLEKTTPLITKAREFQDSIFRRLKYKVDDNNLFLRELVMSIKRELNKNERALLINNFLKKTYYSDYDKESELIKSIDLAIHAKYEAKTKK
ncbi:hypothetical protein IT409_00920 [Candidatus Falkowbacteria bacterium]|nr:hypothetical protein [Candidatus Falkowbacteria bacterium]